ncbi:SRPBCC family protein [Anianabacter salinae]|uniref:SRPBCC family protein n=1 Tax=Anianabacter salinae TaxID=2851023 RepID=UPI00225DDF4E|nr:SRPBCC family protein [Anianabacter salinae]MBV0912670.1 SRPBCC domain-containing protein [Anianabacter salinae]
MDRFATLTFERQAAAPVDALWQAWTSPTARAIWAPPAPGVTVEFLEADSQVGGREVSICRAPGHPDIRAECIWLHLETDRRSVGTEVLSSDGAALSAALVTADFETRGDGSHITVTVQLSPLAQDMAEGYRQGFAAGLENLAGVAARTMVLRRVIDAPRDVVWGAWVNAETLPQWWGPEGFSCRTDRIDLRSGGEWVFDMIGPDGTVYPNHHHYIEVREQARLSYTLLAGENGPKHADAWATFEESGGATVVTLGMVFNTAAEFAAAKGFGAQELGMQTLGKLARFVGDR